MTWEDRIKTAAYTSPSGERIEFAYEDVSRTFDKKTSGFEFPDAVGTYVQDNGRAGSRYPLTCYFFGPDCDLAADAFEDALAEAGIGKLEHPLYGTFDVVPTGTITRTDALKTAANQSTIEVEFWETIPLIYPQVQRDPESDVLDSVTEYVEAAAETLPESLDLSAADKVAAFKGRVTALVGSIQSVVGQIGEIKAMADAKVREVMGFVDSVVTFTVETADAVRASVVGIVRGVVDLINMPSQVIGDIKDRLAGYKDLLAGILAPLDFGLDENEYQVSVFCAESVVVGMITNVVENVFETRGDAINAAADILDSFDTLQDVANTAAADLEIVDTGETYQALQNAVALTAGYLVGISFTLKQERRIILNRARTIVDLAAELYGSVDDQLDFLINSNSLSGSEILELPAGRSILYYV